MRTIYILLLASMMLTSVQSQNVDLSLKLEKGKDYKQTTSSKMSMIQEVMGQKIDIAVTTNGTINYLVKDINEDGYIMDAKYEHLNMSMKMPQGSMEMNSEEENSSNPSTSILKDIKGKTFEITMSKKGKITEVKNFDAIMETVVEGFGDLPEAQKEQIKGQIMQAYGDEAIKNSLEMTTAIYPDKPVKEGDKWTMNTNLESVISMNVSTDYELVELTSDYALIKGNATIKTSDNDANVEAPGIPVPMEFDLAGTMQSEIKVDLKTGWIIDAKINQDIQGEASMKENPQMPEQMPGGMKISIKMSNETMITN